MAKLKIATTDDAKQYFTTNRKLVDVHDTDFVDAKILSQIYQLIDTNDKYDQNLVNRSIDHAATKYESKILPPFFKELQSYVRDLLVRNI